jgi:hypothetical protein
MVGASQSRHEISPSPLAQGTISGWHDTQAERFGAVGAWLRPCRWGLRPAFRHSFRCLAALGGGRTGQYPASTRDPRLSGFYRPPAGCGRCGTAAILFLRRKRACSAGTGNGRHPSRSPAEHRTYPGTFPSTFPSAVPSTRPGARPGHRRARRPVLTDIPSAQSLVSRCPLTEMLRPRPRAADRENGRYRPASPAPRQIAP